MNLTVAVRREERHRHNFSKGYGVCWVTETGAVRGGELRRRRGDKESGSLDPGLSLRAGGRELLVPGCGMKFAYPFLPSPLPCKHKDAPPAAAYWVPSLPWWSCPTPTNPNSGSRGFPRLPPGVSAASTVSLGWPRGLSQVGGSL